MDYACLEVELGKAENVVELALNLLAGESDMNLHSPLIAGFN